jgi:cell division protein FtsL
VRERVVKYLTYYVALVAVLLVVRFATRGSEVELQDLTQQAESLVTQSSTLRREISKLESPARVREWAVQNKMRPFSTAALTTSDLEPLLAITEPAVITEKLKVATRWR